MTSSKIAPPRLLGQITGARRSPSVLQARLRFCVRTTLSAVLAFALARALPIPLHGLWAVLTAVVVGQVSVGGSLTATIEYLIGTLGGAAYACVIGVLVPHQTPLAMAGVLALGVAPLAYAAAVNPAFRVAPFTAVIVLLISSQLGETPVQSALDRLLEVAIGGGVAVAVSLLVFPERARRLGLEEASRVLDALARALPELLAGFTRRPEGFDNQHLQDEIGRAVAAFQTRAVEIDRERLVNFVAEPDPAALAQILLRIRHDFVMLGRASGEPLPGGLAQRLAPALERIGESAGAFLKLTAAALSSRRSPPLFDPVEASFAAYGSEFAALREAGLTRPLASSELERLFALGFTLQQLQQDLPDLARCVQDWARPASR